MIWLLLAGLGALLCLGLRLGFPLKRLLSWSAVGAGESLIVVRVLLAIGVLTGLWRASGTFAVLTAWGLQAIAPRLFVVMAFVLSCLLSYAIGTAFGTAGTLGVTLMTLARSGGVDELVAAGAILSGIYFGDRCSPISSCAHLVAALTGTDFYDNHHRMMRTALLPSLLTLGVYLLLSLNYPMREVESSALAALGREFNLSPWAALPALLMLVLPLLRVKLFYSFLASILCALACALLVQGESAASVLSCALVGLHAPEGSARALFNGGGLISMLGLCVLILVSGTYSGLFEGTELLKGAQSRIGGWMGRLGAFPVTALAGTLCNAVFCNQTVGVMMTDQLMRRPYDRAGISRTDLAQDMANSVVVMAALIPWSLACSVPLTAFEVSSWAMPYGVYLYLLPLCYLLTRRPATASALKGATP